MMRWIAVSAVGCALMTCGCGAIEETWNPTPETPTAVAPPQVDSSAPAQASAPARTSPRTDLVHLSAGTSLPQSLPTGTTMHFSVDYSLRGRPANSSLQYFWIIERAMGPSLSIPVQLKDKGTLTKLTSGWRPEQAPFRCYIAGRNSSGQMTQVSRTVPLT